MPAKPCSLTRLLTALQCCEPDRVPCSFMLYNALKSSCKDYEEFILRQLAMGMDPYVQIPVRQPVVVNDHYNLHGLPVSHDPRVTVAEWVEHDPDEEWPILVKEYHTPAGTLRAEVRRTPDWRWGDHVPFLDDYLIPRSRKFLVTEPADLEPLGFLLAPPTAAEVEAFRAEAVRYKEFARRYGLLVAGGWGVGADLLGWIVGLKEMVFAVYDRPDFVRSLLAMIAEWNTRRMALVLAAGVDLYIKRAWYENCDFWTPAAWSEFLAPILKREANLAHEHGALFGYIITANCMPLLEGIAAAGVDVVIGVDPHTWDLAGAKSRLEGRVCLWGGVNGHLTVEQGKPEEVRAEVRRAMESLAPGGGFILSPVDNVREDTPRSRANVEALLDEWGRLSADARSIRANQP